MEVSVIGRGIYRFSKAAQLLRLESPSVNNAAVRRWAFGYLQGGKQYSGAIRYDNFSIETQTLSFLELVELAYISGMLESGASWSKVRRAMQAARQMFPDDPHPFARREWFADPGGIYLQLGEKRQDPLLLEMGNMQYAMKRLLRVYLKQLRFNAETQHADMWSPLGDEKPIIVDPQRAFGLPIVASGVRTDVLAGYHRAGDPITRIASWYDIPEIEVEAAIDFEERLQPIAA